MTWLTFVLAVLASYRLAHMAAMEEGPFAIFDRIREKLGGNEQKTWIGRGVSCPLCLGWWISLLVSFALLPFSSWQDVLLNWWGVAGGMMVIHLTLER